MAAPFVRIPGVLSGSGVGAAAFTRRSGFLSSLSPWALPVAVGARTTATSTTSREAREGEDAAPATTTQTEARGDDGATGTSEVDNDFGFAKVGRKEHKELVKDVFMKGRRKSRRPLAH